MTGAVLDRPGSLLGSDDAGRAPDDSGRSADDAGRAARDARRQHASATAGGRGATLEERLNATLHSACADGSTECPVCDARVTPARDGTLSAECGGCGSRLS